MIDRLEYIKIKHFSMPREHQVEKYLQHKWQKVNILSIKRTFTNWQEKDKYPYIKISKNINSVKKKTECANKHMKECLISMKIKEI